LRVSRRIVSEIARDEPVYERDGEIAIKPRRLQSQRGRYRPHQKNLPRALPKAKSIRIRGLRNCPRSRVLPNKIGEKSPIDAVPVQSGYIDIRLK
jgi:hypothetical protein